MDLFMGYRTLQKYAKEGVKLNLSGVEVPIYLMTHTQNEAGPHMNNICTHFPCSLLFFREDLRIAEMLQFFVLLTAAKPNASTTVIWEERLNTC